MSTMQMSFVAQSMFSCTSIQTIYTCNQCDHRLQCRTVQYCTHIYIPSVSCVYVANYIKHVIGSLADHHQQSATSVDTG